MENICFFNSLKFWGGGEKLHLENALEFRKLGYQVFVFSKKESPLWQKAKRENIKTYPVKLGNLSFLNPLKIFKIIRYYKKEKIDTVVFSSSQDFKMGSITAYLAGVKRIVYLRGLAVPIKNSLVNRIIFKYMITHVLPNSEETKRNILQNLKKYIAPEKIKTIYHGVDFESLTNNKEDVLDFIRENGHGIILGNAGRLTAQKGQDKLIEVAKKLKEEGADFSLFIAGTGELQEELEQKIKQNELDKHVFLLGFVEDMQVFMNSIDIFLLSSAWEGFGFVLVEAMIKSKPIVAFNISSNPEVVTQNESGFLVEYPQIDAFVEQTSRLIKDKDLRQKMGEAGLRSVKDRFILSDRVKEIESFLLKNS